MSLSLEQRNQSLISAVIEKARRVCPDSLAMIGVYGSFQTGDTHPKSDLDLMILINDEKGFQLSRAFIQDDLGVGHDLYCTTWESLREDAAYPDPHIKKLMDAEIVYCADERYLDELELLRAKARAILEAPFSLDDYRKAEEQFKEARVCYADAMTKDGLPGIRYSAGGFLYYIENAYAMLNKRYFQYGVKRRLEELSAMPKRPDGLIEMIEAVAEANTPDALKAALTELTRESKACFMKAKEALLSEMPPADGDALRGTYEEMVSNWGGKMALAAEAGDRHLALNSLASFQSMLDDLREDAGIAALNALSAYDPEDLKKTDENFRKMLDNYLDEYRRAGLRPVRYPDVETFIAAYLGE